MSEKSDEVNKQDVVSHVAVMPDTAAHKNLEPFNIFSFGDASSAVSEFVLLQQHLKRSSYVENMIENMILRKEISPIEGLTCHDQGVLYLEYGFHVEPLPFDDIDAHRIGGSSTFYDLSPQEPMSSDDDFQSQEDWDIFSKFDYTPPNLWEGLYGNPNALETQDFANVDEDEFQIY